VGSEWRRRKTFSCLKKKGSNSKNKKTERQGREELCVVCDMGCPVKDNGGRRAATTTTTTTVNSKAKRS
jgi:hypothetical protein